MKKLKHYILSFTMLILLVTCVLFLNAQDLHDKALVDSLLSELSKPKNDTDQVKLFSKLSTAFTPISLSEGLNYAGKAMDLARKVNWTKGIGLAYMNKATIFVTSSDYTAGLENADKAYGIFKSLNRKREMANALVEMASSYEGLGYYTKAIEYNYNALSMYEEAGLQENIPTAYNNIGNNYYWLLDYQKAIENYNKALQLFKKKNDKLGVADALDNIALVYLEQGEFIKANNYNLQAIKLFEEINNAPQLAITYALRGGILQKQQDFDPAFQFFNKAVAINKKLNIGGELSINYSNIGELYLSVAKNEKVKSRPASFVLSKTTLIQKALFYFTEALKLSKQTGQLSTMMEQTALLSQAEELAGNYKAALAWYKQSTIYKDSIFNDENKKKIAALENERLAEVKNKEIQLLSKENALQKSEQEKKNAEAKRIKNIQYFIIAALGIIVLAVVIIASIQYRNNKQKKKANILLQQQKEKVESTLTELKSTQAQLIQSEKMASLGELTAGIAHEIQNPLNFVNNFSEVNQEMIDELQTELKSGNVDEAIALSNDIKENEGKITHHGKRADAIVKGMLQHSRASTGQKELTDINRLADEYLRLSYYGMRAKDKSFNAEFTTDFDENIGKINVVPQDIGRVILNVINNAFYAVNEKSKNNLLIPEVKTDKLRNEYMPFITVRTKLISPLEGKREAVEIKVKDNGNGIPQNIIDKIFQPFFTTKPTGQGTGLGLSLAYDIIKAHGGGIKVESRESEGSEFVIVLPV